VGSWSLALPRPISGQLRGAAPDERLAARRVLEHFRGRRPVLRVWLGPDTKSAVSGNRAGSNRSGTVVITHRPAKQNERRSAVGIVGHRYPSSNSPGSQPHPAHVAGFLGEIGTLPGRPASDQARIPLSGSTTPAAASYGHGSSGRENPSSHLEWRRAEVAFTRWGKRVVRSRGQMQSLNQQSFVIKYDMNGNQQ